MDAGFPPSVFVCTGELPCWNTAAWHAIVIIGYDDQSFYVNDPAFEKAAMVVAVRELDLVWLAYDSYYALIEPA